MSLINTIFGIPLGYLMFFSFKILSDYGLSIIFFTFLTKIIMFPLSLLSQKNSIRMVKMKPVLDEIKERYADNPNLILSEQKKLYKEEKYSSFAGILPLLLQIPLILGLINVIYNPLQHLIHLDANTIALLIEKAGVITNKTLSGAGVQIEVIRIIQENAEAFKEILGTPLLTIDFKFLGLDLSQVPSLGSILVIIPILSGVSSFILSAVQNRYNVLQREQGFIGKWGMAAFLVLFSTYFAFVVPAGIGVYWVAGNILSIPVLFICNMIYNANKYIDYENRSEKPRLTKEEKKAQKQKRKAEKALEKEDVKRFFSVKKKLVFYSESNGFYKYFSEIIDKILENSDLDIHYVTSDFNDNILKTENPHIFPYYVGGTKLISFMMRMDADMVIMTMPDLEQYHIKRSIVRKDVEYIYLDHGMTSFHLMLREHALDAYDTIFCYGPNHIEEIRETEKAYKLKEKRLVKTGYALFDTLLKSVSKLPQEENDPKRVLIAPSWQKDNILENCLDELLTQLLHKGYHVTLRPHPEFIKRFPAKMKAITNRYQNDFGDDFEIEADFSSNTSIYTSDVVITDWSSIAQEFSYTTKRPSLFINTPMKIMNPNYKLIKPVPLDISLRDEIGVSVDVDKFSEIPDIIDNMLKNHDLYRQKITKVVEENIYNIGKAAEVSADYIINRLKDSGETQNIEKAAETIVIK